MSHEAKPETADQPAEIQRLQFLMRSGNSFVVDGVTFWEMKYRGDRISSLTLNQHPDQRFTRVLVGSIALAQIEAVVILPPVEQADG